jgi:hypothetical protein
MSIMGSYNIIVPKERTGQVVAILQGKFGDIWRTVGTNDYSFWDIMRAARKRGISIGEHELGWTLLRLYEEGLLAVLPNQKCECKECT